MTQAHTLRRIAQARTRLVLDAPFFGALALRLRTVLDADCPTAWTDGETIGYCPSFVAGLSDRELAGLVAHEVMHVAAGHPWRRGNREHRRWNIACDYAINELLADAGMLLPAGALRASQYRGKAAEWIYDRLPADPELAQQPEPAGLPGQPGEVRDAPSDEAAPTEAEWRQAVQQAANTAAARGSLPGALRRFAEQIVRPQADWRTALQRYAQERAREDYTWARPNGRYMARGLYLPALHSTDLGRIVAAVDTSGSVDQTLLAQFSAELNAIAQSVRPAAIEVIYCDSQVQHRRTYEPGDTIALQAMGGGGTDFRPVFEAIDADGEPPVCLIYLTDLYGPCPSRAPDYPVLWTVTSGEVGPWGETLRIE